MLNILRPAVLRQYYGLNVEEIEIQKYGIQRYTYGSGTGTSTVGIDPNNFVTREMTELLIGSILLPLLSLSYLPSTFVLL